ncbi:sugar ABC transporter substrate-binding protein [Vallitalea longa]|uniref:Sugar ABC transporter substrate-binding protein n=1 Tax=Vallitalea longa TaxID=2936439 RepID=A0A9W5YA88_9FIRM|nr:extracellular solute-binding protein [Vallitalea longa]GKX29772.1 sugar ABC transporter substrate-binding protein [Vallitalea longa]
MKMIRKMITMILVVVIVGSLFVGCGKKGKSTNATADKGKQTQNTDEENGKQPIDIEFMLLNNKNNAGEDFIINNIMKDKFNINIKFNCNTKDAHMEKLQLLVASDKLPDIISPVPGDLGKEIGAKGALIALDEHFDAMPNFEKKVKQDPNIYASLLASDGHIYNLPRFSEKIQFKSVPIIRKDLVEEVNMEIPKDFDQLHTVLKAIKEKHPDMVGMVNRNKMNFLWAYGVHYNTNQSVFYDINKEKWTYGPLNEGFKELVEDFNGFWEDGLMDQEFFTASRQQWEEKLLDETGVFTIDYASRARTETEAYRKLHPDNQDFQLSAIMPLTTNYYEKPRLNIAETVGIWTSFGVGAHTKHLDRVLEMIDYMYSDEAATLIQWGEEGKHYIVDNDMKQYVKEIKAPYNPEGTIDGENDLGLNHNRLMRIEKDDGYEEFIDGYTDMLEKYKEEVEMFENNYRINLTFTEEELEEKAEIETNLLTYVEETSLKFITGETSMSDYDKFVEYLEGHGGNRLEEIYATAYDRYNEKVSNLK